LKKLFLTLSLSLLFGTGVALALSYFFGRLLDRVENAAYDWRYQLKYLGGDESYSYNDRYQTKYQNEFPYDYGIHIVDIDDRSMEKMGSYWSWDRGYQAQIVDSLSTHFPAAIVFDVLFYGREDEMRYKRLSGILNDAVSGDTALERHSERLSERLAASVNYDERFARAIANSGRVTLGFSFDEEKNFRNYFSLIKYRMSMEWHNSLKPASALELPDSLLSKIRSTKTIIDGIYPENARVAKQIGHVNAVDVSLIVRSIPLLYRFAEFSPVYLPMSIRVAAELFGTPNEEIVFKPGKYIDVGKPFKVFKDASGAVSFSYPDFTEAQFRIFAADREGILSLAEGQKRRVSSYIALYRDSIGGVCLETRSWKAPRGLTEALLAAALAKDVDADAAAIGIDKMGVGHERDIGGGFAIRRDSDIEWEAFSGDTSFWLNALEVKTLSSLTPSDLELAPGINRRLVTFDFWVKREKGVLVSSLPVLRSSTISELLAGGDGILESLAPNSRRDFGKSARVPLLGDNNHVVTYFGPKSKPFPYYSFCDIMENNLDYPMEGRVFIVGSTSPALFDIKSAPHERIFPAVEIHASLLNSVFTGEYVRRLALWQDILILILVGSMAALIAFLTKPFWGGAAAAASIFVYAFVAYQVFDSSLIWIEIVRPIIAIALSFTAVTVYRYITEEKNRKFLQNTFKQYLSPELIDMMYTQKQRPQLGGEEGVRTAFFTDIEGFSTFSEKLGSPTRLVELLNEYLSAMTDILLARYGTLDKYEGDAIIAFFGAPVAMPDHAAQACRTALDMQKKLGELREKWRIEGDKWPEIVHNMRMRIGINTGAITTGNMGSAVRMNYTMMGDAVNLAARLESAAKNYGIYTMISNYTHDMVADLFEMRKLDTITVVGKSEPVTVYELICEKNGLDDDARELLDIYNQGIYSYYHERDWNNALECFVKANELEPNRKINSEKPTPSMRFIDMCKKYIDNPPGDDWDGVNRLTSK
jgi:adenylate cyclase